MVEISSSHTPWATPVLRGQSHKEVPVPRLDTCDDHGWLNHAFNTKDIAVALAAKHNVLLLRPTLLLQLRLEHVLGGIGHDIATEPVEAFHVCPCVLGFDDAGEADREQSPPHPRGTFCAFCFGWHAASKVILLDAAI